MSQNNIHKNDMHTTDFKKILREEERYIKQRRKRVHITEGEAAEGKWGVAFSNGGARASTLMLGVMRKLMSEGIDFFRRIDYLSAVGGSSFMAAAFASLLSGEKSTDKRGLFGTRPHNSPFLPETNAAKEGKGVKPDVQMAHFRKRIKDIPPHFWEHIGGTPGLFGIGASGMVYAFSVLIFVMIGFMSLHHLYFYWISQNSDILFQKFIATNKTGNFKNWDSYFNVFDFWKGVEQMVNKVWVALQLPESWWVAGIVGGVGLIAGFSFFYAYLRPALRTKRRHDVHIEIKTKEFNYFGFILTYCSLFVFGWVVYFSPDTDYSLAFVVPIFLTFGILISCMIYSFVVRLQYTNDDNRRIFMAEILTAALAMFFVSVTFPVLLISLLLIGGWLTLLISIICFAFGIDMVFTRIRQLGSVKAYRRFGNSLPNFFIGFSIVLLFASAGKAILRLADINNDKIYQVEWFIAGVIIPAILLYVFSLFDKKNRNNLHSYFKNRKSDIFLITDTKNLKYPARDDSELLLHGLAADNYYAPYLLLNATLNVHSSAAPNTRKKRGTHFYFSKDYIGSEKTGYVRTEAYEDGKFTLADAMMTAAANYHSGMGIHGFYSQAFLFTLLNLRLGRWLRNPWYYRSEKNEHSRGSSRFMNFIREYVNRFSTRAMHINVSSGIHTGDHWGLTALLRRQCENIILFDFRSPDDLIPGELNMTDIRAIAAKYGASVGDIEIAPLQKKDINGRELCESNVISCTLTYESGGKQGRLYYIKLTMSEALPSSILEYRDEHPEFPFKFTSNMQSPDLQFNTFVQLGEQLAEQFYDLCKKDDLDDLGKIIGDRIHQLDKKEKIENLDCEGLRETERIYIERLTFFRKEKAITADVAKKFELDKEIEEMEREIADIRAEMLQKGCVEVEADTSEAS